MSSVPDAVDLLSQSGAPDIPRGEGALAEVADPQCGLVTRPPSQAAGLTPEAIESRLRVGGWLPVHRGVYQTRPGRDDGWRPPLPGSSPAAPVGRGHTARRPRPGVWSVLDRPTLSTSCCRTRDGSSPPPASPCTAACTRRSGSTTGCGRGGPPWSRPSLDVGASEDEDGQLAVLATAFQRWLVTEAQVRTAPERRRAHPCRDLLDTVLAVTADGAESPMEVRYARDVQGAHQLPVGTRQHATDPARRARHAVAYPAYRLLVELDGRLGHDGWAARVADGVRDRGSAASGWLTTRAYWRDVTVRRCELAAEVGAILRIRGWDGEPRPCRRRSCVLRAR